MEALLVKTEGMVSTKEFIRILSGMKLPTQQKRNGALYYNVPAAFDIETSSFYENGIVSPDTKRAIMYHWQFGIAGYVTYGRTWEEYRKFIVMLHLVLNLSDELRLPVYVHNLPYEFQWMRKWFNWDKVFMLDDKKPAYALSVGIEYRDMLKLAGGKSLANAAKDLQKYKVEKMVGDLDYSLLRTPLTPLNSVELKYCENDIRVCMAYIAEKIEQDGGVTMIPMTNTGYVRQYCRRECRRNWKRYRNIMNVLTIEPPEYVQLKKAFQGGFVHANSHHARKVLHKVGSEDLTSAYPARIVLEKFPMSKGKKIEGIFSPEEVKKYFDDYCCMFDLVVTGLTPKLRQEHPLSDSKCKSIGGVLDNGRIVTADFLITTVTDQDLITIERFYDLEKATKVIVTNLWIYEKDYLPKAFVRAVLGLYKNKTELKGLIEEALNYMISKNMLNACYGMCVTDIVREVIEYIDDWKDPIKPNRDNPDDDIVVSDIEKYNKSVKRFLFYPWGVWITAYCRRTLFAAIEALGDDYVYSDTDSVKCLNPEKHRAYFEEYNKIIMQKIKDASEAFNIPESEFCPKNKDGISFPIGLWDDEGVYDVFKTLGAKRYLVQKGVAKLSDEQEVQLQLKGSVSIGDGWCCGKDKKLYKLTVAGTNKEMSCRYMIETGDPFDMFDEGLDIPRDKTGKRTLTYINFPTEGMVEDYNGIQYRYMELSSIHMENAPYHLSLGKEFLDFLEGIRDASD